MVFVVKLTNNVCVAVTYCHIMAMDSVDWCCSLLATSPHVSTMCAANVWACEGTWVLVKYDAMRSYNRWNGTTMNWSKVG